MNHENWRKRLAGADRDLWSKYMDDKYIFSIEDQKRIDEQLQRIPDMILESDLEAVFCRAEYREATEEISEYFRKEYIEKERDPEHKKQFQEIHDKALDAAMIRSDFATALRSVRKGTDLSSRLGFGFSSEDLKNLMELHKSGEFRRKIEDLLTDCNFHEECGLMENREYEALSKRLKNAA